MMVAGHLQIKNEKYYMVLELRTEQGERKTKWIGTGLAVKGNKRRAQKKLWPGQKPCWRKHERNTFHRL